MPDVTPEAKARHQNAMLVAAGWAIQNYKTLNLGAACGIALREVPGWQQRGGLGKAHQLFGKKLPKLLDKFNEALAA